MDFEAGRDFLLADDPTEIAAGIHAVLEDPALGASLAASAHRALGPRYGRSEQTRRLRALFQAIVNA